MTLEVFPTGEDKRHNDPILMQLIRQIHDSQLELDRKLTEHMTNETKELADSMANLIKEAFPDGDTRGHREAHDAWIREVEQRTDFYRMLRNKLAEWGLIGFCGWAAYALWQALLNGPHK